ncbi:MAG: cbb3-type cytochrome c oxidase subunit I [Acidimicrobiales bacterium]|jgi:cytochrome c oxidase subunit I
MTMTMAAPPAPAEPAEARAPGGLMRRLNFFTGLVAGIVLAAVAGLLAHALLDPSSSYFSDQVTTVTFSAWVVGFLLGVGALNAPICWALGRDLTHEDELYLAGKELGARRYWKFCTDHKVVGIQYFVMAMIILFAGGVLAMLIRIQLMSPGDHFVNPQIYNTFIGMHGILMVAGLIIAVSGPFGNFILPIMIGARDMAFPRLNALSFWLVVAAAVPLLSVFAVGGIGDGWSTYAPLAVQDHIGMDAFAIGVITFILSTTVAGVNMVTTFITMRTKGMRLNRVPIFTWGVTTSSALGLFAMPFFAVALALLLLDRTTGTSFYLSFGGGSGWLWENLFWLMGHPEVYVILLPGVGAILEIATVFARKPLFGYQIAVGGMIAIAGISIIVWAHHMFTTGWAPSLNGPFMLTTELVSIPTGVVFLALLGTIWQGNLWMRLPMLYVFGVIWNFIIGGITGIYLSDVPVDNQMHGSMFVVAHFHYVLVGSVLLAALGAVAYWFPKITGRFLDERLGRVAFWIIFLGVQVTFLAMFISGLQGMPRRVSSYAQTLTNANFISSIGAFVLMAGMVVELYVVVSSWRSGRLAPRNPWHAKTLEWQVPTPVPLHNFEVLPVVTSDPYGYGEDAEPSLAPLLAGDGQEAVGVSAISQEGDGS